MTPDPMSRPPIGPNDYDNADQFDPLTAPGRTTRPIYHATIPPNAQHITITHDVTDDEHPDADTYRIITGVPHAEHVIIGYNLAPGESDIARDPVPPTIRFNPFPEVTGGRPLPDHLTRWNPPALTGWTGPNYQTPQFEHNPDHHYPGHPNDLQPTPTGEPMHRARLEHLEHLAHADDPRTHNDPGYLITIPAATIRELANEIRRLREWPAE